MRTKILLLGALLICSLSHAQTANDGCTNGISTNPVTPLNPQTSSSYMNAPKYINSWFNWYERVSQNELKTWDVREMSFNPLNQSWGAARTFISPYDPNGTVYNDYNNSGSLFASNFDEIDFFPEDGWELLFMNTGYFPDGTETSQGISNIPYVVLYNKYRSVIRVFGKTGDLNYIQSPVKSVQVKFNFKSTSPANHDGVSALFSGQGNTINALDKKTEVYQVVALANHPNTFNQWFHADFHVNYDPCECYFKSELQLSFKFITSSTISLAGRSVSTEQPFSATEGVNYSDGFLTNIYTDGDDESVDGALANSGSIIYRSIDEMIDDYDRKLAALDQYNGQSDERDKARVIFAAYKAAKTAGVTYLGGLLAGKILKFSPQIIQLVKKVAGGIEVKLDPEKVKSAVVKQIFNLSKSLDAKVEHKLGLDVQQPPTPTMPMATFTEMSFTGKIETRVTNSIPSMINPGTYNANTVASNEYGSNEILSTLRYPIYNEALGTFAVLETPKVKLFSKPTITRTFVYGGSQVPDPDYAPYDCESSFQYNSTVKYKTALKLAEPLKFYFSPSTSININKSRVRFQLIFEGLAPYEETFLPHSVVNLNKDEFTSNPNYTTSPMLSMDCFQDLVIELNSPVTNYPNEYLLIQHGCSAYPPELDGTQNGYANYFNNYDFGEFSSDPVGMDAQFYDTYFRSIVGNKVYLKVIIDAEFNEVDHKGEPNTNTMIYTYELPYDEVTTDFATSIPFDITNIPSVETIETKHYTQNGYYNPLEMLSVIGDLTSNDGLNHTLFAQEEVNMLNESAVVASPTSDFNLQINPLYACSGNSNPVTSQDVNTFCHSSKYNANKLQNPSAMRFLNPETINNARTFNIQTIDLMTNINNESVLSLTSKNEFDKNKNFKLTDMQGRSLFTSEYLPKELNMSNYSTGVYVVEYQTEKGIVRKKVIKSN